MFWEPWATYCNISLIPGVLPSGPNARPIPWRSRHSSLLFVSSFLSYASLPFLLLPLPSVIILLFGCSVIYLFFLLFLAETGSSRSQLTRPNMHSCGKHYHRSPTLWWFSENRGPGCCVPFSRGAVWTPWGLSGTGVLCSYPVGELSLKGVWVVDWLMTC